MTVWWYQSTKKSTPGTEPNHLSVVTFWQRKKVDSSLSVSVSASHAKAWKFQCCFCPVDCLMEGKTHTLSDPHKMPSVNKHHIHNEKQPTLKCLSFIIQTDFSNKEPKQKHKSNFQQIKEVELWLTPYYSFCSRVWEVIPLCSEVSSPPPCRGKSPPFLPS